MKIIQFQPQVIQAVDKLGQVRTTTQMWGLGDDGKIYIYDFITLEWVLQQNKKQPDQKKPEILT